jgi:hypothetical protein
MRLSITFFLLGSLLGCSPSTPAPVAQTVSRLQQVNYILAIYQKQKPEALSFLTSGTNGAKEDLLGQFLMREETNIQSMKFDDFRKLAVDGWGHPFNVASRGYVAGHDPVPALLQVQGDILVWSSGPDGTNQFGRGDDVVCPLTK